MKGLILQKKKCSQLYLNEIFRYMDDRQVNYNWLISDYECYPQKQSIAEKLQEEYCFFSGSELTQIAEDENLQWIWGVFSAFPQYIMKEDILKHPLPQAREYTDIWKNPINIQHPLAEMEIIAWDGIATICLSKDDNIIDLIQKNSKLAKDLEAYNRDF